MKYMVRYNLGRLTKILYDSRLTLFRVKTIKDLIGVEKESVLFNIIRRLILNDILERVERDKYLLKGGRVNDFTLATFLYPSYISFESALNFYGILAQFPYQITSATGGKTLSKIITGKTFAYFHLQKKLYWGYEKKDDFLIAYPEKALLDQMYLASKGLKKLAFDEYDLSTIDFKKIRRFLDKYPTTRQFRSLVNRYKKFIITNDH